MKYRLKVYSILEFGQRKDALGQPHQEDSTFPALADLKDSDRTFILCDGMGGHDAGEVASETVCQAMGSYIINDGHDAEGIFTDNDLAYAITAAFDALDKKDSGAEKKMGTTMTFLKLHNQGATIAHMGDSRVYHIRPGADGESTHILFRTEDHSLVNDLIRIGELTPEEARHSRQRNVITRAMQPNTGWRPKADVKHITDIRSGDYFYMCSDGMLEQPDMEDGTSLRNVFSKMGGDDEQKVKILKSVTEKNKDNHTALIIHVTEVSGPEDMAASDDTSIAVPDKPAGMVEDKTGMEPHAPVAQAPSTSNTVPARQSSATDITHQPTQKPAPKKSTSKVIGFIVAAVITVAVAAFAIIYGNDYHESSPSGEKKEKAVQEASEILHLTPDNGPETTTVEPVSGPNGTASPTKIRNIVKESKANSKGSGTDMGVPAEEKPTADNPMDMPEDTVY